MDTPWRIELFGGLRASLGSQVITRFSTRKAGALLAYLAYFPQRSHSREELIEIFWTDAPLEAGRNSLRVALNSLRRRLELPGMPRGSVLVADAVQVHLNPAAVTTDVREFEALLVSARQASLPADRVRLWSQAVALVRGELLPGYYEEWLSLERHRLSSAHYEALRQLSRALEESGELSRALDAACRTVQADPLREEAHLDLMRLYVASGQPAAALRQYQEWERMLWAEFQQRPAEALRRFARQLQAKLQAAPAPPSVPAAKPPVALPTGEIPSVPPTSTLPTPFPAARLPLQFTRFFGREREIKKLMERLWPVSPPFLVPATFKGEQEGVGAPSRLVTLTGPGGTGKTRLAVEVAGRLSEAYQGAIWFVELAEVTQARYIPDALLQALHLERTPDAQPMEQVVAALSGQLALLVLDNFEHLAQEGVLTILTLRQRIPTLTLLVTSRRRLALPAEQEFPLAPLPLPDRDELPERVVECASVQLFVDRAQAARPDFQVTPRNAATIAALCQCLEGVPLAIELAAARALTITPQQMLERLQRRFELLVAGRKGGQARHRSLWEAIDWSYRLLSPELQHLFLRVSVFRGGWTLEAAQRVCDAPGALDCLTQLRSHSLVLTEEVGGQMRFRLLETLREFAREKLSPPEMASLRARHGRYFLQLAEEAEPELDGPRQDVWLDRLESEHHNLRAALDWSVEAGRSEIGLRLGSALRRFWDVRGPHSEGRAYLGSALALSESAADSQARAAALHAAGDLADSQGDYRAAVAHYRESLRIRRLSGDREGIGLCLNGLGIVAFKQGDTETAGALYAESLEIARELGNRSREAIVLGNLGSVSIQQKDYDRARRYHEASLVIARELGNIAGIALALHCLGIIAIDQKDYVGARTHYRESLALRRGSGDRMGIAGLLYAFGNLACEEDRWERSIRLFGATTAMAERSGTSIVPPSIVEDYHRVLAELRAAVGEQAFAADWRQGHAMTEEQAVAYALEETETPGDT
jgi:predicted ATPase/DNA-binding SARP family transcriptional activator